MYIHYGCGLDAPKEWKNFDISPTLRIQKIPVIGQLIVKKFYPIMFPDNVIYGDIISGLPGVKPNSCKGVYCSHTLEHLSLEDFRKSIQNTFNILQKGGIFRCVVPDLEYSARKYITELDQKDPNASLEFLRETILGKKTRPRGTKAFAQVIMGNANHLWMWDHTSLQRELEKIGFSVVRRASFNDSKDEMFALVENKDRFINAVAIEAVK